MKFNNLFILGIVFVFLFGCINLDIGDTPQDVPPEVEDDVVVIELNPSFSIIYPSLGVELESTGEFMDLDVLLQTSDIKLTVPSSNNVEGEGHFVLTLDGDSVVSAENSYVFQNVGAGEHTLKVEFVNNDGSSHYPQLQETISFSIVAQSGPTYEAQSYNVVLENGVFTPSSLDLQVTDNVVFGNEDAIPHGIKVVDLSTGEDLAISSPLVNGQTFKVTFDAVGEYGFSSLSIPTISGTVTVSE
uniref:Uncharacterized protein n=1 Tax=uncultured marine group II/III euryarchaeote KM3_195_B08 TaxID=1457970 RepID=A0A075GSL8_9EURY|nr:hypothetical protein [uncultured marine group II/III euryarchaeote KM3_195_B08]